mmetsp:Transcript_1703/g.2315  ORF Transcript_1703/g.2315 Transcript_1703/m.2315 type:complete len:92 (-) Transcript_1703:148-423(-)
MPGRTVIASNQKLYLRAPRRAALHAPTMQALSSRPTGLEWMSTVIGSQRTKYNLMPGEISIVVSMDQIVFRHVVGVRQYDSEESPCATGLV